ncbi:hypothetical protein AOLI_G00030430 [Acnodon oligacanthus]
MRGSVTLSVLLVLCHSSFTRGDLDPGPSLAPIISSLPETSSPPNHNSSAVEPSSPAIFIAPHLNTSSEVDSSTAASLSADDTIGQSGNDTTDSAIRNSTEAPASTTAAAGTAVAPVNRTSVSGNLTYSTEGSGLSARDNHTLSATTAPTTATLTSTPLPKAKPHSSTSAPTTVSQTLSASTTVSQNTTASRKSTTTSPEATTAQSKQASSTDTTKGASTTTTTTLQTTETSKPHNSTEAHADTPSELNVGDDESSATMDPLLAGLVSVFVVTAAIVSLLIFLKFRRHNERPEFRRLQDLPMDDMMEDTPLSMYSY